MPHDHDAGRLSRRRLIGGTLAASTTALGAAAFASAAPAVAGSSAGFRWCNRCQGMWFRSSGDSGHCPVHHWWDHSHYEEGSGTYWFTDGTPQPGQDRFGMLALKWCLTCKAAYFSGGRGVCPNNENGHTPSARTFRIETDLQPPLSNFPKQGGWCRCRRCRALFYLPHLGRSHCPAATGPTPWHDGAYVRTGSGWRYENHLPRLK
ncbi:hypothetical protein LRS74_24095 [Streptomyces sp. LX-29]|uniref:hypothetical protein n=1 Tax=Streptomyces sp. LX-29 TaxID=2900152 RepID=UPI00240D7B09|nr:hypothetical protein [Streptomyces sp. LX-29]WFB09783.1 hypothetical protein LRS74_24095 [Streptomyces sp. LX-29]